MQPSDEALRAARATAAGFADVSDLRSRVEPYLAAMWDGAATHWPALCLDDVSEIPFLDEIVGVEEYQHRARLRARDGDLFATITPAIDGYQAYCRDVLGLGSVEPVVAEPVGDHLAVAHACGRDAALEQIVAAAKRAGGLLVHPYMSIAPVWDLAARVQAAAAVPVQVLGPPPPVTWIANDKAALHELVVRVLGPDWLVETLVGRSPHELADHLRTLAARHRQVGLKRLRCASAMGNLVLDGATIGTDSRETVESVVAEFLVRTQWDGAEAVQAVAWEDTELSPSTQLWIPPRGHGEPRLEGIYEQILEGPEKIFVGSRPAELPAATIDRIGHGAVCVAAALQELGYSGRCSFDFLVVGDPAAGDARVLFTECNGRWGGTSTPMHLVDRLVGAPRPTYRAQDFIDPGLVGRSFDDLLAQLGDAVFDPRSGRGRYVFYNVNPLPSSGKLDVIAFGRDRAEADAAILEDLPRALGLRG